MSLRPDKVLIYRLGSLGDTLVALPALHWIRAKFPGARITMLNNCPVDGKASRASTILESTGLVNDYLAYPLGTRNLAALFRLRHEIATCRFDMVFTLNEARGWSKSIRDWMFFRFCGVPKVVGSALREEDLRCMPLPGGELYEPEARRLLRRVGAEGQLDLKDHRWWDLRLNSTERAKASQLLAQHRVCGGFIALSMGTKFDVNDWTLPNWRRLVAELGQKYPKLALVAFGVAEERRKTDDVLQLWPGLSANLCGSLSPRMSAAVLERATIFIGHDSGPMHLAAAVGVSCVAIFSARNPPGQWFPRGEGHQVLYHRTDCFNCRLAVCSRHEKKCILGISIEEVLAGVGRVLGQSLSAPLGGTLNHLVAASVS